MMIWEFIDAMKPLHAAFGRKPNGEQMAVWHERLYNVPLPVFKRAVARMIDDLREFPTYPTIWEFVSMHMTQYQKREQPIHPANRHLARWLRELMDAHMEALAEGAKPLREIVAAKMESACEGATDADISTMARMADRFLAGEV